MKKSDKMMTEALLAVLPALVASSPYWMVVEFAPAPLNVRYALVAGTVTFSLQRQQSHHILLSTASSYNGTTPNPGITQAAGRWPSQLDIVPKP